MSSMTLGMEHFQSRKWWHRRPNCRENPYGTTVTALRYMMSTNFFSLNPRHFIVFDMTRFTSFQLQKSTTVWQHLLFKLKLLHPLSQAWKRTCVLPRGHDVMTKRAWWVLRWRRSRSADKKDRTAEHWVVFEGHNHYSISRNFIQTTMLGLTACTCRFWTRTSIFSVAGRPPPNQRGYVIYVDELGSTFLQSPSSLSRLRWNSSFCPSHYDVSYKIKKNEKLS